MNPTALGAAMDELVMGVQPTTGPPVDVLWRRGTRRRVRNRLGGVAAVLTALALVAFVGWPSLSGPAPEPPPQPARPTAPRTYPSVLAHPYFAPDALSAHRAMSVAVLDGVVYVVDAKGAAWKVPDTGGKPSYAALSPNGRWLVDGHRVHDLVEGRSDPVVQPGAADDLQLWASWAPDSGHYARGVEGADGTVEANGVVVSTPQGAQERVPTPTPYALATRGRLVMGGWVDASTLMVAYASLSQEQQGLQVETWQLGDVSWRAVGLLTYPDDVVLDDTDPAVTAAVSPDGRVVAMGASVSSASYDTALVTWDLAALLRTGEPSPAKVQQLGSRYTVDGLTWRAGTLLLTVSGRTGPLGGPPVVESTAGFAGRTSWRSQAFDGEPYWNSTAVWRARLVVWTTIPLALLGVWLLWRAALWGARRLGIIDGPLPLRFDLAWWRR